MEEIKNNEILPSNSTKKKTIVVIILAVILCLVLAFILLNEFGNKDVVTPAGNRVEENITNEPIAENPSESNKIIEKSVTQAPGANLITPDNRVVDTDGNDVRNDVSQSSPSAPQQTQPITKEQAPLATELELSANGFSPAEFRIKRGEPLTIALSGSNDSSHVFKFEDKSLSAIGINVRAGETRAITFNAPEIAGEYKFFCDFPGHIERGEVGKMIVE